jgi:hypothetical protein
MNTETPTPTTAAELLAEWKALVASIGMTQPSEYPFIMEISAQLDQMCDELGLFIIEGCFVYAKCVNGDGPYRNWYGVVDPADWVRITAKEQQALQEWLLIKENHGK